MVFESSNVCRFIGENSLNNKNEIRIYNHKSHFNHNNKMWTLYIGILDFKDLFRKFMQGKWYSEDYYRNIVVEFDIVNDDLKYDKKFDKTYNMVYQKIEGYYKYEI